MRVPEEVRMSRRQRPVSRERINWHDGGARVDCLCQLRLTVWGLRGVCGSSESATKLNTVASRQVVSWLGLEPNKFQNQASSKVTKLEYNRVEGSGFEGQMAVESMIDYTARP